MLIRNGKAFTRGLLLLVSFLAIFVLFFSPVFPAQEESGQKTNGLVYADHLFNTLSKGSSLFLDPTMQAKDNIDRPTKERTDGKSLDLEVPFNKATDSYTDVSGAQKKLDVLASATALLKEKGFEVSESAKGLKIKGDLYPVLQTVLADSLSTYHNKPEEVSARHGGMDGRAAMKTWWHLLSSLIKPMQRAGLVDEA